MRSLRKLLLVALASMGAAGSATAQAPLPTQLSPQQHSRAIRWRQIVTPHYVVIFSDQMADEAQRAATLLERAYDPLTQTLGKQPERIPVILAAESLVPNAFVAWYPRRTTWNPLSKTSAEFAGPVDWYNVLAVHEGRHIAQERHMRSGLIGLASRIFGDDAAAILAGRVYFPDWLWEGDAVGMETALTAGGRGRQPSFLSRVRALRLTGQEYPFYPAWLGSYRTYYPGAYELGYLLTTHARRHYGADVWARSIRRAARYPLGPFSLPLALSSETGKSLGALHRDAVAEAESLWKAQQREIHETAAVVRSRPRDGFHIWHWPQYTSDGSIVAAYTDLDNVTPLVRLDSAGNETILLRHFPGRGEFPFHVAAERVIWLEYDVHPRWGELDYLTIKEFDIARRAVRTVRSGTRFYAVALAPAGARLAALEITPERRSRLLVLDAATGATQQELPNPVDAFLTWPAWNELGTHITTVAIDKVRGNALVRIDINSGQADTLISWTFEALSRPVEHRGRVYFGSARSGIDNIHAIDITTKQRVHVTSRRFGAYHADVTTRAGQDMLVFRDLGAHGDEIAEMRLDGTPVIAGDNGLLADEQFVAPLIAQERDTVRADSVVHWPTEPYGGLSRFINVHSFALLPGNDNDPWVAQLFSRNALNTVGGTLAYRFNPQRRTHGVDAGLSYAGLWPILDLGVRVGTDAANYVDSTGTAVPFKWNERAATLAARLPLTFARGLAVQRVQATASLGYTHIENQPVDFVLNNNNGVLQTASYTLLLSHGEPAAYRDLVGTGAYALGRYRHTPLGGDYHGHTYMLQAGASARGALPHHGVSALAAIEEQRPTNYAFGSIVPFARGYEARARYKLWRAGMSYALPLWYPDINVGPLLFVRRVQAEGFGDYSVGYSAGGSNKTFYRSAGVELTADIVPLSIKQTWRAGIRYSYRVDAAEPWRAQFIMQLR